MATTFALPISRQYGVACFTCGQRWALDTPREAEAFRLQHERLHKIVQHHQPGSDPATELDAITEDLERFERYMPTWTETEAFWSIKDRIRAVAQSLTSHHAALTPAAAAPTTTTEHDTS